MDVQDLLCCFKKDISMTSDVKAVQELNRQPDNCYTKDSAWDLVKGMEDKLGRNKQIF